MSNTGLSTRLGSNLSGLGWKVLKASLETALQNPKPLTRPMACMQLSMTLPRHAAHRMTTHKEADSEVAELKARYEKVKGISDEWCKKVDTLVKEWKLLDTTVNELNSWVAQDRNAEGEQQYSLEKMESTLGELKNIFKEKEKLVENL